MIGETFLQEQLHFIHEHAGILTAAQMAKETGMNQSSIYAYCKSKGLNMTRVNSVRPQTEKPVKVRTSNFDFPKQVRHKAVYDNKSSEQRIDELLNQ
jgi:hypothetical protein